MNKRKDEIIEAFKIGYQSGHEETVEGTFGDPLDEAEDYLEDVEPKRHPDPNGVLPLTEEEREEFTELFFDDKDIVNRVYYDGNSIVVEWKEPDNNEFGQLYLDEVSAILYLAERFELNGGVR